MGLYLRNQRSKIESGTALVEALRESASHGPLNCFDRFLIVYLLDMWSWDFEVVRLPDMDFHQQDTD